MYKRLFSLAFAVVFFFCFSVIAKAISAKGFAVIGGDTGEIIYSGNADERLPMASTTKIMTALLLCESGKLNEKITVTKEMVAVEGSSMGILPGDIVTGEDLLYGMMLPSGNDAANVTAYLVAGSKEKFVDLMNQKANALGLKNTHFNTPSGLDGESHYTTAYELALITMEAFKYKPFEDAVKCKIKTVETGGTNRKITLVNHNKLLDMYSDVVGVKTGFTKKAGRCLVSAAKKDGRFVIAVTLNDGNDWKDARALLDIGLNAITVKEIPENTAVEVSVVGSDKQKVKGTFEKVQIGVCEGEEVKAEIHLPQMLFAPVEKGDIIGRVDYTVNGKTVKSGEILASEDAKVRETSLLRRIIDNFKLILLNV